MTYARFPFALLCLTLALAACGESSTPGSDAGGDDSATPDTGGADSGGNDAGGVDSGSDGGVACSPVACGPECRTYVVDGCEACYCPPANECTMNEDCVLGSLTGICCGGCVQAFPREAASENACIIERYTPSNPACVGIECELVDCPAIACAAPSRAICDEGTCRADSECEVGDVMTRFGCAPACTENSECSIRTNTAECCTDCESVMHTSLAESLSCFFGRDETPGAECSPAAGSCDDIACPDIACEEITAAVCNVGTGLCEAGTSSTM